MKDSSQITANWSTKNQADLIKYIKDKLDVYDISRKMKKPIFYIEFKIDELRDMVKMAKNQPKYRKAPITETIKFLIPRYYKENIEKIGYTHEQAIAEISLFFQIPYEKIEKLIDN